MTQARRTWNAGDIPTNTDFNNCVRDSTVFGVGAPIVGSASFPSGGGFLIQAGQILMTTNAAGGCWFTFPAPFPSGVLSVIVMVGDSNVDNVAYVASLTPQTTLTGWGGIASNRTGNYSNGVIRLNYIAIGW